MIPVYKPYLPEGSMKYAHDALDSGWLSQGPYLTKAREMLSEMWGTDYIILTNSGTAANHMIARTMRLKYPWRRNLIVPNNVYVAAWNPFLLEGFDLKPIDADLATWNMDIRGYQDHRTNIILAVHNLGNIINVPAWRKAFPNTPFIEDNCEGFGGMYGEPFRPTGTSSDAFSVSFYGNKNITTGEGGAFVTYDKDMFDYAHSFHGQGSSPKKFIHHIPGYNYRMNNVQAAILCGQLEILDGVLDMKRVVFDYYSSRLQYIDAVDFQYPSPGTQSADWMFGIRLIGNKSYIDTAKFFTEAGIETRPMFYPITYHKHLNHKNTHRVGGGSIDVARRLSQEVVILPSYPELTSIQQDFIIEKVEEYVQKRILF
jgi:perosamine synthetase